MLQQAYEKLIGTEFSEYQYRVVIHFQQVSVNFFFYRQGRSDADCFLSSAADV